MVEEIFKNIYRIGVPLKGNPLKELNSYFIRGFESDLLIDTGFRMPECEEALLAGLAELKSDPLRRDVYVTHLHADHSGMADKFVGEGRSIYISEIDLAYNRYWSGAQYADKEVRFLEEGFTKEMLDILATSSPASIYIMKDWSLPCIKVVKNGDVLSVGDYDLEVIFTPGHTPGNTMLWNEKNQIMFSGDNILFDITPNITFWETAKDSLGDYLETLEKSKKYPVKITFPGHRKTGDYHARIEELLKHHEIRIAEAYERVCQEPGLNATEIAGKMSWRIRSSTWEDFPLVQKRFAVGEAMAHLDYLMQRNKITRKKENGTWHYYKVE